MGEMFVLRSPEYDVLFRLIAANCIFACILRISIFVSSNAAFWVLIRIKREYSCSHHAHKPITTSRPRSCAYCRYFHAAMSDIVLWIFFWPKKTLLVRKLIMKEMTRFLKNFSSWHLWIVKTYGLEIFYDWIKKIAERELGNCWNWNNILYSNAFFWAQKEFELEVRRCWNYVFEQFLTTKIWKIFR